MPLAFIEHLCDNGVTCRWDSCARNSPLIGVFRGRVDRLRVAASDPLECEAIP